MKIGISSCLLGNKVRYNGGHAMDHYIHTILGKYVEWVPVCPEFESGLPVPREAMHLVGTENNYCLKTVNTNIDYTEKIVSWSKKKIRELANENLCGFIFKSNSPSSGMRSIKIYPFQKGIPIKKGIGLFAKECMNKFPCLPVEDEGRLHDAGIRENFIERIFAFDRWKKFISEDGSIHGLINFHSNQKLLIMAHSPHKLRDLGNIVAHITKNNHEKSLQLYRDTFLSTLALKATVKKNVNVLQHCMGYVKKQLPHEEKIELQEIIDSYHHNHIPLICPILLILHFVRKYDIDYLKRQYYLNPHPRELMLRNHV